nr:protein argonaute 16-like [Ipomoea batatas]
MIESLFKPLANGEDDGIMREMLLEFYQTNNGRKPAHIIVFRDGVSESQFNQVLNIELDQMIKVIWSLFNFFFSLLPKYCFSCICYQWHYMVKYGNVRILF